MSNTTTKPDELLEAILDATKNKKPELVEELFTRQVNPIKSVSLDHLVMARDNLSQADENWKKDNIRTGKPRGLITSVEEKIWDFLVLHADSLETIVSANGEGKKKKGERLLEAINQKDLIGVKAIANTNLIAVPHVVAAEENLARLGGVSQLLTDEKRIVDHLNTLVKPEVREEADKQLKSNKEGSRQTLTKSEKPPASKVEQLQEQRGSIQLTGRDYRL